MKLEKGLKIKFKYPESSNNDNREQFKAKEQHAVWCLKMIPPQKKTQNTRVLQNVYVKWNSKKNLQHILSIKFLKTTSMPGLQNNFDTKANLSFNYIPANCLKHPCNIYYCFFVEMKWTLWAEKSWSLPMAAQGWNG